jgi:hypothetical protein
MPATRPVHTVPSPLTDNTNSVLITADPVLSSLEHFLYLYFRAVGCRHIFCFASHELYMS